MSCGGIEVSDADESTGWEVGEADKTGPGGGGWFCVAVLLWEPGRIIVSES